MDKLAIFQILAPTISICMTVIITGWVVTTWMRIKNGYPLDGTWGEALYPKRDDETTERVKLLTQENAQLRAELGSMKDRHANVERIVTDAPARLAHDIDQLRDRAN